MPSSTLQLFDSFGEAIAEGKINLATDTLTVALTAAANAPVVGNSVLTDLTQISYTNCSSRVITTTSSSQSGGTYSLVLQDLTLSASGGDIAAFRYVVIYSDTATNDDLIGWLDYGSDVTVANGESLTIDFPAGAIIQATQSP